MEEQVVEVEMESVGDEADGSVLIPFQLQFDKPVPFQEKSISSLCWSPDGEVIALGTEDGSIFLHDVEHVRSKLDTFPTNKQSKNKNRIVNNEIKEVARTRRSPVRLVAHHFSLSSIPLAIMCTYFLISSPNNFQFLFFSNCHPNEASNADSELPDFRLLIGILTVPNNYKRRNLLRMAYDLQRPFPRAQVDVHFVFCNLTSDEQREFIGMEILAYNDIIILNCKENMNDGKTYTYFSSLPQMFEGEDKRYDYVMKTDDDTYPCFNNFLESLRGKPKEDMYWGSGMPMLDQENPPFMAGPGYILSWDLVQWIATSDIPRSEPVGPEDIYTGMWLNKAEKGINRYNVGLRIYNFNGTEAKDFLPDTIAVHMLKNDFMWAVTLKHFNVTGAIKPSILYHF